MTTVALANTVSADSDASLRFGLMLNHVRHGLIRRIEQRIDQESLGINFSQFRVLKALYEGQATTPSEIARWIGHDAGALTRMLDQLARRGYLRREPRAGDRRQFDVVLTEQGLAVASRIVPLAAASVAEALGPLSPLEREQLIDMLDRIREGLSSGGAS